jgi:two-component system C4-dicarboxylate transport response regulator DctD
MIFLAEDDEDLRTLIAEVLRADGHQVKEARDGRELEAALDASPDHHEMVICDLLMPGINGLQVLEDCRAHGWSSPFILMTGFADEETRRSALRLGALAVVEKPMGLEALRKLLDQNPGGTRP